MPDTVITPLADLIVDDEYDPSQVLTPLMQVQESLAEELPAQHFLPFVPSQLSPASTAICHALQLDAKHEEETTERVVEEAEEAEEEMVVNTDVIKMEVPGRTKAVAVDQKAAPTSQSVAPSQNVAPASQSVAPANQNVAPSQSVAPTSQEAVSVARTVSANTAVAQNDAQGEEGEAEELNVVQVDGVVTESLVEKWVCAK